MFTPTEGGNGGGHSGGSLVAAAVASADKTTADKAAISSVGKVTGFGSSCWHSHVIPFTIKGTYDFNTGDVKFVKQHEHEKVIHPQNQITNNILLYV